MEEDRKTAARRASAAHISILAAIIIIAMAFLTLWNYSSPLSVFKRDPVEVFCCRDVLQSLWEASNVTINPCKDFYTYTCYHWDQHEKRTAFDKQMLHEVTTPTYTGLNHYPAGKAVAVYYGSCLYTFSDGDSSSLDIAVAALLDVLKPPRHPTPNQMLQLLLSVCLVYKMTPGLQLPTPKGGQPYIILRLPDENSALWSTNESLKHREQGLKTFNAAMSTNVSWDELRRSATSVFLRKCKCCTTSVIGDLTDIFKTWTIYQWEQAMIMYSGRKLPPAIKRCSTKELRVYADAVIEGGRPTSLALLVVEASVRFWESFRLQYGTERGMNKLCETRTENLNLLWDTVVLGMLGDPRKDILVRNACTAVGEKVILHASSVFPPADLEMMRDTITKYKIILASDLHLLDTALPDLTSNFWHNDFAIKNHEYRVRLYQHTRGLPSYVYGTFKKSSTIQKTDIGAVVPPSLYSTMVVSHSAERAINTPVIGPDIAKMYWDLVLDTHRRYSSHSIDVIMQFRRCGVRRRDRAKDRLYVETVVNASRRPRWSKIVYPWGLRRITRSQIFYMRYGLLNLCGKSTSRDVQRIFGGISDFLESFSCPLPPNASSIFCNLGA